MADGYKIRVASVDDDHCEYWYAAIDNVERAVAAICEVAQITDRWRLSNVENLTKEDIRSLGLSAGNVRRIEGPAEKPQRKSSS
jgi:hypothetical protein